MRTILVYLRALGRAAFAGGADAQDLDLMAENAEVDGSPCRVFQAIVHGDGQVDDTAAHEAASVIVLPGVRVEARGLAAGVQLPDLALHGQLFEIAVHGRHADVLEMTPGLTI